MIRKSKAGFISVYLCLFFLTLVSATLLIIGGIRQSVLQSQTSALCQLWGQSVLAEYDLNLQSRYGLFGFYGYPNLVKDKVEFYSAETFDQYAVGIRPVWNVENCSLYAYTLRNTEIFRKQIIAAGKAAMAESVVGDAKEDANTEDNLNLDTDILEVKQGHPEGGTTPFQHLPSSGTKNRFVLSTVTDLLQNRTTLRNLVKKGTDTYFEQAYAFAYFQHKSNIAEGRECFLQQEIEYLICGKQTDAANESGVKNRIIAVREAMNLIYLNQNEKTRTEALTIAEIITPGPAAVATQQTLLSMWALAESVNDYRLLLHGYRIPLMKTEDTWAMDLDSVIENEMDGYIYTGEDEGESYEDYLKFFLYTVDETLRLLRMMDLIQMNMHAYYYDGFRLEDYYGGVSFTMNVNGRAHQVELCYE